MWFRVDDGFLEHPKTLKAIDVLSGQFAAERIAAVWLESGLYSARNLTDGFIPSRAIARFQCRRPEEALDALITAGLAHREDGGIRLHDWEHYNPSSVAVKAKRARDRARKAARDSARNPRGIQTEPEAIPQRSRARDPVPSRPQEEHEDPALRAASFPQVVEKPNTRVLQALARETLPTLPPGLSDGDIEEHLKTAAARAGLAYDSTAFRKAVDAHRGHERRLRTSQEL